MHLKMMSLINDLDDDAEDLQRRERQPIRSEAQDFVIRMPAGHPSSLALRSMVRDRC